MTVVQLATVVDSIAPTALEKYYLGLGAFQVGSDALQKINTTRSCAEARLAEDMWTTASIDLTAGAQAGSEQGKAAAEMLTAIQQYSRVIGQAKKAYCKVR